MKNANGVEIDITKATCDLLENCTDATLSRYAASTKRDISKCIDAIEVLEKAIRKVTETLLDELHRNQERLDENQAFAYRIFVEQENR